MLFAALGMQKLSWLSCKKKKNLQRAHGTLPKTPLAVSQNSEQLVQTNVIKSYYHPHY